MAPSSGTTISGTMAISDASSRLNQAGKPEGVEFPDGLIMFQADGVAPGTSATFKVTFPSGIAPGSKVYQVDMDGFHEVAGAVIEGDTVTMTVTNTGTETGVLVNPVGVAAPVATGTGSIDLSSASGGGGCSVAVRTGSGGSYIDGTLILAGLGLTVWGFRIRRRRSSPGSAVQARKRTTKGAASSGAAPFPFGAPGRAHSLRGVISMDGYFDMRGVSWNGTQCALPSSKQGDVAFRNKSLRRAKETEYGSTRPVFIPFRPVRGGCFSCGRFSPLPAASAMEAVDFREAVARTLSNNAFVSAAGEDAVAARRDADVARGYLLPSVRFDEKFVRTSVPGEAFALKMNQEKLLATDFADVRNFNSPPPRNDFVATLSLEQPLFAPKAYIGYGMAKTEADARSQDLYRRKEEAVYRVLTAVLDVITARQFVEVTGQALSDAREHLRIGEPRGGGDGAHLRCVAGERRGRLRGKLEGDGGEPVGARAPRVALAMGEPGARPVDVTGPLPEFPDPGMPGERGTDAADRADLRASSLRVDAGRNVRLRRSGYLPDVGLAAAYQVDAEGFPLLPRQPLLEGGRRTYLEPLRRDDTRGGSGKGDRGT